MRESRFFVLLFVGLIPIAAGTNTSCPIEMSPDSVVVKYGDPVTVNCTTSRSDIGGIGWEASQGGTKLKAVSVLPWTVASLTDWNMSPICYFSSDEQCSITLGLVVYAFPEAISISSSSGPRGVMQEGEKSLFTCDIVNVAPLQNLTVTWFKGDKIIHKEMFSDSRKEPVNQSSVLQFTPTREDNGLTVRCEAHLDLGPRGPDLKVSSEEHNVTVKFGPDVPCTAVVEITEGQTLDEKCPVTGNPTPYVIWLRDGKVINSSVPFRREDAGMYTVEAEGSIPLLTEITFIVLYGPELSCPSTYTVLEYAVHNLNCAAGYPTPKTIWYKDGEEVELPESLTRRDAGQYMITASNGLTSVNSTVDIVVLYPPSHIVELEDTEIDEGAEAWLKCSSTGNPRPKYSWIYYQADNVVEESEDGTSRLIIHNATANNMGSYTCRARNDKGTVYKTVTVTVNGAPPECPVKITPDTMVVEYQSRGQHATCQTTSTSSSNVQKIYWEVTHNNKTIQIHDTMLFPDTQNGWDSNPTCFGEFQGIGTCDKNLKFILYKTPDSVSIRHVDNSSSVLEDKVFQLHCHVVNVAPAQHLTVRWYRGNETIGPGVLSLADCQPDHGRNCDIGDVRSPVDILSTVNVTLNRTHSGADIRCDAHLDLGLQGWQSPVVVESAPLNLTVLYKPTIDTTKLPKTVPLFRGYPEELVCEAHGRPAPEIQWLYSPEKLVEVSEGKLIVHEEGVYNCSARNDVDSTSHVVEVVLKEDYLPLIAGFVAVTVIVISVIFVFLYSIYYKNTKMRRYSLKNPKLSTHNGNVATNGWDVPLPMTKLS